MSASSIKAGEAYVVISAKLDQLKKDLAAGNSAFGNFGKSVGSASAAMGPFGVAAGAALGTITAIGAAAYSVGAQIVGFGKMFADAGSVINDMAARTGLSADQLQAMKFAAEQTGASLADVEIAARNMAKNGFRVSEFERIGQQIAAIEDPSERAATALEVFGKSGTKVLPMFAEWNKLKAASAAAGPVLSADEVARADMLGDAFSALKESLSRVGQQIGSVFAPSLQEVLEILIGMTAKLGEFVKGINVVVSQSALLKGISVGLSGIFGDLRERGQRAVSGVTKLGPDGSDGFESKSSREAQEEQLKRVLDFAKQVNQEYERRQRLIESMLTPHEQFKKKEQEILAAIQQARQQGNAGVLNLGQANRQIEGLNVALGRLREQERQRQLAEMPKPAAIEQAAAAAAKVQTSSAGTFSGAAAGLLGRAGDPIVREQKQTNDLLRKVEQNTRNGQRLAFT